MVDLETRIVPGGQEHGAEMVALLPELAKFELLPGRMAEHLWHGDRDMLEDWLAGNRADCFARVAIDAGGAVLGFAFVTMREELLSHEPSAHLEVLVVAERGRRAGLGAALCSAAEAEATSRGAHSITLHVFANNQRARSLYKQLGYDEELLRCTKALD